MARPGITEGVPGSDAPESGRLDMDPGRNVGVGADRPGAETPLSQSRTREALENAQAAERRAHSAPSYQGPAETTKSGNSMSLIILVAFIVVVALAYFFYWS